MGNIKTSIVFGTDALRYETEAQSRQNDYSGGAAREFVDSKAMKKTLTATHFVLGNTAATDYRTESRQQDPTGRMHEFCTKPVAADPRKSSCYFGSEKPVYTSTMHDGLSSAGGESAAVVAADMREQAKQLKAELSHSNILLGKEQGEYETTSRTAFQYDTSTALDARGQLFEKQKADLRRQHFELGSEQIVYETDAMRSMKCGAITDQRLLDMRHDAANAATLKHKLLATSVVIGDDPDFMD